MTVNIPRNMSGSSLRITLRDRSSRELSQASVSVKLPESYAERPETPTPFDYECPLIGQAGRPIQISGLFDGDFATTELKVGGRRAYILAESPRKLLFEAPIEVSGATEMLLNEKGVVVKRPFTSLRVVKIGEDASSQSARVTPEGFTGVEPQAAATPAVECVIEIKEESVTIERPSQDSPIIEEELVLETVAVEVTESQSDTDTGSAGTAGNEAIGLMLAKQLNVPLEGASMLIKAEKIDTVVIRETETPDEPGRAETSSARSEDIIEENILVEEKSVLPDTAGGSADASDSSRELIERIYKSSKGDFAKPAPQTPQYQSSPAKGNVAVRPGAESQYSGKGKYTVQVASFRDAGVAERFAERLRRKGYKVSVAEADIPGKGRWSRVRVGTFATKRQAREYGNTLKRKEPSIKSVYITVID
jgi:cell division septation protein DedD